MIEAASMNKRIGADLKALRKLYGVNQEEMAEILGVIQSAVSRIESGAQKLSAEQFLAVREWVKARGNLFLEGI
jgi:transcriptional regulator with XRE-family HTH domain